MSEIRATYAIETPLEPARAAQAIVADQGLGGEVLDVRDVAPADGPSLLGRMPENATYRRAVVDVSVPLDLIGPDLLTVEAALLGNVFELRELSGLRLLDFTTPPELAWSCPGPAFGVAGTRRLAGVHDRPLIGTIIKPSVGLTPAETAERVLALGRAGLDFVKDDELLGSVPQSPLPERVAAVSAAVDQVEQETGKRVMVAFNISSDDVDTLLRNHDLVVEAGGTCVMASINHVGLSAFLSLRERLQVPVHAHRNGWGMLTRSPALGMAFPAYRKLWGLAGVDQLHVNGFSNKFWEPDESVATSMAACAEPVGADGPILPVVSSGQWGGQAPATWAATRTTDLLYLAGGGIQGHPDGFAAGVEAIQAAWDAAIRGVPLDEAAREVPALATSMQTFGAGHA